MRKILKYGLYTLGALLLLVLLFATYNILAPLPTYPVQLPEKVDIPYGDSLALARGAKIVNTQCAMCHRGSNGKFIGQPAPEKEFGDFYIANITNHPEAGIGKYSDAELVHLLRTGLRPNGELLLPIMSSLTNMSDRDISSIVAYLRSDAVPVQPEEKFWPDAQLSFLAKALMRFAFKPNPMPDAPIVAPDISDLVAHGEYLANDVFECYNCHSASFQTNNTLQPELSEGFYGGGNVIGWFDGEIYTSANLTQHPTHGLGQWTQADFARVMREKKRPDGQMLAPVMPLYAALTDEEIAALWAYLQTVPVQDNAVLAATPQ